MSGIGLTYLDSVQLVKPVLDDYAAEKIGEVVEVGALFIQNTGFEHASNQDGITSDAEIYIDPEDAFVVANKYRLEEMLVIANIFGADDEDAWYRIISVTVGMDKLLDNDIDNILLKLQKTTEIQYVS